MKNKSKKWFSDGELFVTDVLLGKYKRDILPNHGTRYNGERESKENEAFKTFVKSDLFKNIDKLLNQEVTSEKQ